MLLPAKRRDASWDIKLTSARAILTDTIVGKFFENSYLKSQMRISNPYVQIHLCLCIWKIRVCNQDL